MNIEDSSITCLNALEALAGAGRGRAELLESGRVVRRLQAPRFDGCRVDVGAPA
jgi:hypothetical protein